VGSRGQQLEFSLPNMLMGEGSGGVTAVKDHKLVAPWESQASPNVAEKGGGVPIPVSLTLAIV